MQATHAPHATGAVGRLPMRPRLEYLAHEMQDRTRNPLATAMSAWCLLAMVTFALALGGCPTPRYPACANDNDCHAHGEICIDRVCQQCRGDSDCPAPGRCLRNRCYAGTNGCGQDADCPAGAHCVANVCEPATQCGPTQPCPAGRACENGQCVTPATPPNDTDPVDNHGRQCTFEPVYFTYDNAQLDEPARTALQHASECLQREATTRYVLIGRTDPQGREDYNLALGERRARTAQRYLTSLGVAAARVSVSSEGEAGAVGTDEASWGRDRRVDFRPRD